MERYRYSGAALFKDYLRAGVGLAATAGPILWLEPATAVVAVLIGLAALFGGFAVRTGLRQFTVIEVTADGIAARGPVGCFIPWHGVKRLRLDYFAIRREPRRGWLQLKISGRYRRIRIDSTLDDFARLAAAVAIRAREHAIPLSDTAVANFQALGIVVDGGHREIAA